MKKLLVAALALFSTSAFAADPTQANVGAATPAIREVLKDTAKAG